MKLDKLLEELHADEEKVLILKAKRFTASQQIKTIQAGVMKVQLLLDAEKAKLTRKRHTFKLLDEIVAEFEFSCKQKEAAKAKQAKKLKTKTKKTAEQVMADVMSCLNALPKEQQQRVFAQMKEKNNEG